MNKNYYAIIPANVRYDKELKANAKLLYGELTALSNEKGYCWATNNYFAELYGVSKETVSRWISQLDKKGYISIKIIFDSDNRTILERRIYINGISSNCVNTPIDKKINTPIDKKINTHCQKNQQGIDEKVKDNNTINNTINICMDLSFIDDTITNINLTKEQYDRLINKYNEKLVHDKILLMSASDKQYKDHYRNLNLWCNKDKDKEEYKKIATKTYNFDDYIGI